MKILSPKNIIKNLTDLQILFLSFLMVIVLGGGMLSLPISSITGEYTNLKGSIFTVISAICVTRLAALDTKIHF